MNNATAETPNRPAYSHADLDTLKTFGRAQILETFESFDDHGLSDDAFALQTAGLLDPTAIPNLTMAAEAGDATGVREAIYHACMPAEPAEEAPTPDENLHRQADDILAHRFCFYDETHQLPLDIDWDHNPGTAHWSHDLNRFSFLVPLTDAYIGTGDTRYSRKVIDLILDCIAKCDIGQAFVGTPYMFGGYLNEAIHRKGWAARPQRLLPHDQVKPGGLLHILKSLHDQVAFFKVLQFIHS